MLIFWIANIVFRFPAIPGECIKHSVRAANLPVVLQKMRSLLLLATWHEFCFKMLCNKSRRVPRMWLLYFLNFERFEVMFSDAKLWNPGIADGHTKSPNTSWMNSRNWIYKAARPWYSKRQIICSDMSAPRLAAMLGFEYWLNCAAGGYSHDCNTLLCSIDGRISTLTSAQRVRSYLIRTVRTSSRSLSGSDLSHVPYPGGLLAQICLLFCTASLQNR